MQDQITGKLLERATCQSLPLSAFSIGGNVRTGSPELESKDDGDQDSGEHPETSHKLLDENATDDGRYEDKRHRPHEA